MTQPDYDNSSFDPDEPPSEEIKEILEESNSASEVEPKWRAATHDFMTLKQYQAVADLYHEPGPIWDPSIKRYRDARTKQVLQFRKKVEQKPKGYRLPKKRRRAKRHRT